MNVLVELGSIATPYSPAPEDFYSLKGKQYTLSQPIIPNQQYVLSFDGQVDDYLSVWGNNEYLLGFIEPNKNSVKFNVLDENVWGRNLLNSTSSEWRELQMGSESPYVTFFHPEVKLEVGETYTFRLILIKLPQMTQDTSDLG